GLINSGAIWGGAAGGLAYVAFGKEQRLLGPLIFAGLNIGLITGAGLASQLELKRGRVALIDASALAGLVTRVAVANAVKLASDDQGGGRFGPAGMVIGLVAGSLLTAEIEEPEPALEPATSAAVDSAGHFVPTFGFTVQF